jgi:hypothetical protein
MAVLGSEGCGVNDSRFYWLAAAILLVLGRVSEGWIVWPITIVAGVALALSTAADVREWRARKARQRDEAA